MAHSLVLAEVLVHLSLSLPLSLSLSLSQTLSQRISAAKAESYDTGYREGQQATPTDSAPSEEAVGRRVKSIMNHAYQTMSGKVQVKEEFQRSEILSLLLATIKVCVSSLWQCSV